MRLAVLSCIYGRPKLTKIFCQGLHRLKQNFDVVPLIVGSEGEESMRFARDYGLLYIEHKNKPLGAKFNYGMKALSRLNINAVMVLGSDDFVDDQYIELVYKSLKDGADMIGTTDCYFYSQQKKQLGYWSGYAPIRRGESIGLGRVLSKKLLNRCNWTPWTPHLNKGLDGVMTHKLNRYRPKIRTLSLRKEGLINVDVKGKSNITGYGCYDGKLEILDNKELLRLPEGQDIMELWIY